jgi:NDP-sugar pyrophosphorylase family protein
MNLQKSKLLVNSDNNINNKDNMLPESKIYSNRVILMVGGLGARLKSLTENHPKPMLNVGGKPILQTIVEQFVHYGFTDITMCVNYKSHVIEDFFGNGNKYGAEIDYVFEEKRMGTAGALSLLSSIPEEPFFVMNGDLLTNVSFNNMLEHHIENKAAATMCVREYDFQVPYGVLKIDDGRITAIEEKPVHKFFINGGIYILKPETLKYIPENNFFDMPQLFQKLLETKSKISSFPLSEYWLDIGQAEEYKQANIGY